MSTPSGRDRSERVHVELDWYDGPRRGLADVDGVPHYFASVFDDDRDTYDELFQVWPVDARTLALERQQWRTFVAWNDRYEAGVATVDQHPGHRGIDADHDRIEDELEPGRRPPSNPRTVRATWQSTAHDNGARYTVQGPDYRVIWG